MGPRLQFMRSTPHLVFLPISPTPPQGYAPLETTRAEVLGELLGYCGPLLMLCVSHPRHPFRLNRIVRSEEFKWPTF
jgi:hypothetical protein